jgi:hypothetical protein
MSCARTDEVAAIHSHMLDEQPRLIFMHFWPTTMPSLRADCARRSTRLRAPRTDAGTRGRVATWRPDLATLTDVIVDQEATRDAGTGTLQVSRL